MNASKKTVKSVKAAKIVAKVSAKKAAKKVTKKVTKPTAANKTAASSNLIPVAAPAPKPVVRVEPTVQNAVVQTEPTKQVIRTRFLYLRNKKEEIFGCLAYHAIPTKSGYFIHYGVSTYNPKDKFNRSVGREIAESRLTRRPMEFSWTRPVGLEAGKDLNSALAALFEKMEKSSSITNRIQKVMPYMHSKFYSPVEFNPSNPHVLTQ